MKTRFSTEDIVAIASELQRLIGMRVNQVYDVDSKTYLIKLNRFEEKVTLLLESGIRIHTTEFDWPKSMSPSGFSMKLRKHIKNKRLEKIMQLGVDRILDLQFGINDAAYHVILELYDRGNLVLTDYEYIILNILRPRTDNSDQDVKFIVKQKYPIEMVRQRDENLQNQLLEALNTTREGDNLKKFLLSSTPYGPALLDHILSAQKFNKNALIGKDFNIATDIPELTVAFQQAEQVMKEIASGTSGGFILQKEETNGKDKFMCSTEFHPYLFNQLKSSPFVTYESFDKAIDTYFSGMEAQKIDTKTLQKEREAMKKLTNVKKDHERRLNKLLEEQGEDILKAELIEVNLELVEKAITIVRSAVASQISWSDIWDLIQEAQLEEDPIAKAIKKIKLEMNHFTLLLSNPFESESSKVKPILIDIDLDLSAYGNARKYYDLKRHHAKKEQKTLEASEMAFKNAEKKTKQALKEVAVISTITKSRKPMWFEKFIWFISSENYIVIAGRDIQQNEVIVKRYMKPGDVYVHADIRGASSVVIKNPKKKEISPKTLYEAGTLAVCYSAAWDAKVLTSAWWVYHDQVSKTAPSGEYLTAGSFMIRGKKNYLLPSHLILGFGFLFKLGEDSLERHEGERKEKLDGSDIASQITEQSEDLEDIPLEEPDSSDSEADVDGDNHQNEQQILPLNPSGQNIPESSKEIHVENKVFFPDTEIQHEILGRRFSNSSEANNNLCTDVTENETLIIASNRKIKNHKFNSAPKQNIAPPVTNDEKSNSSKRGKKGKMKKIKEKYRDQDDEERELRMKILASAGEARMDKKKKKGKESTVAATKPKREIPLEHYEAKEEVKVTDSNETKANYSLLLNTEDLEEDGDDETEDIALSEEVALLRSLTGIPVSEDTLLHAVSVCAPYASLQSYKYKIKLMPGTGRRGKAAKTALGIFLHDKTASQREKDCLRSIKDQDISRNFPGKVKLSYAHGKKK